VKCLLCTGGEGGGVTLNDISPYITDLKGTKELKVGHVAEGPGSKKLRKRFGKRGEERLFSMGAGSSEGGEVAKAE